MILLELPTKLIIFVDGVCLILTKKIFNALMIFYDKIICKNLKYPKMMIKKVIINCYNKWNMKNLIYVT